MVSDVIWLKLAKKQRANHVKQRLEASINLDIEISMHLVDAVYMPNMIP